MDQIGTWKRLLAVLEAVDNDRISTDTLTELSQLFQHLSPQFTQRVQKEYESCTIKTEELLSQLFDKLDLSDYPTLCALLSMLRSYGYFKIAQITYTDNIELPPITKAKFYDMCPLLPAAGTIGWKGIMNHGLVNEERNLLQVCLQLLSQKLHFYSIISMMNQFQDFLDIIKRNGERVVEKLFELIRYVAYDDDNMIGLDSSLFKLLVPFINDEQQAAIIDTIIQDLFKPQLLQKPVRDEELFGIYELVNTCIMNKTQTQNVIITKLLEHLKCNVIRRKRRHSVEATQEIGGVTLEGLLADVNNEYGLMDLLSKIDCLKLSAKSLQTGYISYWVEVLDHVLPQRTLTVISSLKIISTCLVLLVAGSEILSHDLIQSLSSLLAKTIENTSQNKLEKLFNSCDPLLMIEITKILGENTKLLATFDAPVQKFYRSYLDRFQRYCIVRGSKPNAEKLAQFVNFICDKSLSKEVSYLLQYICLHQLSRVLSDFKKRSSNKIIEILVDCARNCSNRLYKFIKRNLKADLSNQVEEEMDTSELNSYKENASSRVEKALVYDSLVCTLCIAIERNEQELLDNYSELILKLFSVLISRVENLITIAKTGTSGTDNPLDFHLTKLLSLYIENEVMIKGYLNYDLHETISSMLIVEEEEQSSSLSDEVVNVNKKLVYNQIKTKLEVLSKRAEKSMDVYPTIINKQYSSVVEQSISSIGDIRKEKSCCHNYWRQIRKLNEIASTILSSCNENIYRKVLSDTVHRLEHCDSLDHPRVVYLLLILESIVPRQNLQAKVPIAVNEFKEMLPRISCSLIRITKSIELGPSIHAFTKSGAHKSNKGIQCCTYSSCIKIYTLIFLSYPPKITNPLITDAMQICVSSNLIQYAKYSSRLHKFFIQLASAIAVLLKSICMGRKEGEILRSTMPIFLSMFSNLIRCIVLASDRQQLEDLSRLQNGHGNCNGDRENTNADALDAPNKEYETQLELLAIDIGRTMNNLSLSRVKLIDYSPHLISTYIKDIQRASCPDFVKLHLNEGIFRIFNLVDAHQKERHMEVLEAGVQRKTAAARASGSLFDMIHARLDQASREIFRDMHENYSRLHRYQGKC